MAGVSEGGYAAGEGSTLWIVAVDAGVPRRLTRLEDAGPGGHGAPAWSPTGRRIAFVVGARVFSVRPDGSDVRQTSEGLNVAEVAWGADGATQLWSGRTPDNNWAIWQVDVDPDTGVPVAPPRPLAGGGELASAWRQPTLSSDGRYLAFATMRTRYDLLAQRVSSAGEPLAEPEVLVKGVAGRKLPPIFSRDGRRVAFSVFRPGEGVSLWVAEVASGEARLVAAWRQGVAVRGWLPDGRRVAYLVWDSGRQELRSVDVETGEQQRLGLVPSERVRMYLNFPMLSPDGTALLTQGATHGALNVWLLQLTGGLPIPLTHDREGIGWPSWSPDGRQVAVELLRGGDTQVGLMPAAGGDVRPLTSAPGQSWPHGFSPDGRRIAFAGQRHGIWNVYWVPVDGGPERRLTSYQSPALYVRTPDWSPRGDRVGYEYAESTGTVWVAELTPPMAPRSSLRPAVGPE